MISRARLQRAVREALAVLRSARDVREAEVFAASNTHLLTRLHYTSHLPCNGVEEPKSTFAYGIGIRAVFHTPGGIRVGFGSEPSDLTADGVRRALGKARQAAVPDPEFVSLPKPTGEARSLARYHDPALMDLRDTDLVGAGWKAIRGALRTFRNSRPLAALAGGRAKIASLGLILSGDVTIAQERIAIASTRLPTVQADESSLCLAFVTAMVERVQAKGSGWSVGRRVTDLTEDAGVQAARAAAAAVGGTRVPSGRYRVILGPQAVTDLLTHLILPGLTADTFYAGSSPFQGRMHQRVASQEVTLYDHGAARGLAASKGITCEGLPTGRTDLIREGVLVGLLSNAYETQRLLRDPHGKEKLGVEPRRARKGLVPRNGFRFGGGDGRHFNLPPGIAATNVVFEGRGGYSPRDLLRLVGEGLYIGRIWYTYPINGLAAGDFTCTVVGDSHRITEGRLAGPLTPNTLRINDNILKTLNTIVAVGGGRTPTFAWAADEIVYAPEVVVDGIRITAIAEFADRPELQHPPSG
ncbi:MAG: metallopeptidase TldD-related protein [Candidatus Methylomirabilales bacterium]